MNQVTCRIKLNVHVITVFLEITTKSIIDSGQCGGIAHIQARYVCHTIYQRFVQLSAIVVGDFNVKEAIHPIWSRIVCGGAQNHLLSGQIRQLSYLTVIDHVVI